MQLHGVRRWAIDFYAALEVASLLNGLFDPRFGVARGDPRANWPLALPQEEATIRTAVEKRRREFRAGRALAREAMAALGVPPLAISAAADRSPILPPGVVGSISHCDDLCVAVVGKVSDGVAAIGVDVEPAEALDDALIELVCRPDEQDWLRDFDKDIAGFLARLIFSAKECAYKCQYPITRQMFGFDALSVRIDRRQTEFEAQFTCPVGPFREGDKLLGRYVFENGHLITGMVLGHPVVAGRHGGNSRDWSV